LSSSIFEDGEDGFETMHECVMLGSKGLSCYNGKVLVIVGLNFSKFESVSGMIIISLGYYWDLLGASWFYMVSLMYLS
jgi:hypothetical protein